MEAVLTGRDAGALKSARVTTSASWLTAKAVPAPGDPARAALQILVAKDAPAGSFESRVTVTTSDGQRLVLPVSGVVEPPRRAAAVATR
jgi:hypothetical protein